MDWPVASSMTALENGSGGMMCGPELLSLGERQGCNADGAGATTLFRSDGIRCGPWDGHGRVGVMPTLGGGAISRPWTSATLGGGAGVGVAGGACVVATTAGRASGTLGGVGLGDAAGWAQTAKMSASC